MFKDDVPLRNALVKRLEDRPSLTALVPVAQIFGEKVPDGPTWPFIRYGSPIITSDEASGWTGGRHRVTIHVLARGPSKDECSAIMAEVVEELDGAEVDLEFPVGETREASAFEIFAEGGQIIPDGPDDWHGIAEFNVTVAGA